MLLWIGVVKLRSYLQNLILFDLLGLIDPNMFPFQRSCELSFQQPPPTKYCATDYNTTTGPEANQYQSTHQLVGEDLIEDSVLMDWGNNLALSRTYNNNATSSTTTTIGRGRKLQEGRFATYNMANSNSTVRGSSSSIKNDVNDEKKKIIHREIERQRRQEMAKLFSSLHSLLPTHSTKGKRSAISDHIMEAAEYIRTKKTSIKQLEQTRDRLLMTRAGGNYSTTTTSSTQVPCGHDTDEDKGKYLPNIVVVHPWCPGRLLEIELSIHIRNEDGQVHQQASHPLSRVLNLLLHQGLNIVSYTSANVNHRRFFHIIHAQVDNVQCFDPSSLQRILSDEICSSSST